MHSANIRSRGTNGHRAARVAAAAAATTMCAALVSVPAASATASASTESRTCTGSVNGNAVNLTLTVTFTGSQSDDVSKLTARATDNAESGSLRNSRVDASSLRLTLYTAARKTTVNQYSTRSPFTVYTDPKTRNSGKDTLSAGAHALFVSGGKSQRVSCIIQTF